jgi:cobalt-zinc-cadmium efflux system membrane fusion protein
MEKDTDAREKTANDDAQPTAQHPERRHVEPASLRNRYIAIGTVAVIAVIAILALLAFIIFRTGEKNNSIRLTEETEVKTEGQPTTTNEVVVPAEAMSALKIEIVGVAQRPAVAQLQVTGTVEVNQQQTQAVTPLVGGRVERVYVALGDRVRAGAIVATVASPQIAELRGHLHTAETRLSLAQRNLARVQRSENRVAVIQAKAKLDEAEATLRRVRRLVELGAGAGKDLVAAEAGYKTAKADYDFQSNIALSREVQQAQAEFETSQAEVAQLRQSLRALGAPINQTEVGGDRRDISLIPLRAPVPGAVTERLVNAGAGIEAGKPLFTIANLASVWIIANVPEAQVGLLRVGAPAEVRSAGLGNEAMTGHVNYIDPRLNEETRTARVRVEVPNPGERLKVGMFVEVAFQAGVDDKGTAGREDLVIPSEAVQRLGDRIVVFLPKSEAGHFEVRDVQIGGEIEGYSRVTSGLNLGDRVVTKGGFTLKSLLMKGQFGEEDEEEKKQ